MVKFLNWLKKLCKKSPSVSRQAYFIRYTESGTAIWTADPADYKQLAQDYLESSELNCSVYNMEKVEEEGLIAAAHAITFMRPNVQDAKILRISESDISEAGLSVRFTNGETGIDYFDKLHWEIVGNEEGFIKLAKKLHDSSKSGEDRHRKIPKDICKHFLNAIYQSTRFSKNKDAINNIKKALNK